MMSGDTLLPVDDIAKKVDKLMFELNDAAHAMSLLYDFTESLLAYFTRIKNLRCWK